MRLILASFICLLIHFSGLGQAKLGLKVSPSLSSNRILTDDKSYALATAGSAGRVKFGLEIDIPMSDNYAFGTGIFYSPKRFAYSGSSLLNTFSEEYKLQYVELPVTLKLFTNEIQPDLRMYFQTGALLDVKVFEDHVVDHDAVEIKNFKPYDLAFVFGTGVEFKAGVNTLLFGGLSYERGLVNVIGKTEGDLPADISGRNDLFSLNVGVKF